MLLLQVKQIFEEATGLGFPTEESYAVVTLEQINRLVHAINRNIVAIELERQLGQNVSSK